MNLNKKTIRIGYWCLAVAFAATVPGTALFAADPKIDLGVSGNKLVFLNSACPSDPGLKGCVEVARGSKNWIMWELSNDAVSAGWVLTGLQMRMDDPNLTDCIVRDFNVDPGSGWANNFQVQGNGRFGKNWDENSCHTAYEVGYLVYARNTQTGAEANSDPVIRNGGGTN